MAAVATPRRLSDRAKPWITKIIKDISPDELVTWELAVNTFPDPSATVFNDNSTDLSDSVGLLPALVVYLEIAGLDSQTSIYGATIVAPFKLTEVGLRERLTSLLDSLRAKREAMKQGLTDEE